MIKTNRVELTDFVDVGITDEQLHNLSQQCFWAVDDIYDVLFLLLKADKDTLYKVRHADANGITRNIDIDAFAKDYVRQFKDSPMYANRPLGRIIADGYEKGMNELLWAVGLGAKHYNPEGLADDEIFNIYFYVDFSYNLTVRIDTTNSKDKTFTAAPVVCNHHTFFDTYRGLITKALFVLGNQFTRTILDSYFGNNETVKEGRQIGRYTISEDDIEKNISFFDESGYNPKKELNLAAVSELKAFMTNPADFVYPEMISNNKEVYRKDFDALYALFLSKTPVADSMYLARCNNEH